MLILDHEFLQAVIAKRKRKEERKRLKEAAAARGQHPETSQESVVGRTTSAPEIVVLPAVQRLPESQTANHLAPNPPAIRKKTKKSKKDKRPTLEPSRAAEVPVAQAVGPEIIEILDTDDEDFRPTTLVSSPSRAPTIQVSPSDAVAGAATSSSGKKKKASTSKGRTSSTPQIPNMNTTAIASSSSREKTPIPQTSSPDTTIAIISPSSETQKKKVSGSKEKSQKAEKAARKQARAERRAREAERRAKRAGKDKNSATAVASVGVVTDLDVGGVTGSTSKEGKKKDKQKTLRAAWVAGGRKEMPIVIEEERERSVSPLMQVNDADKREWEAEERFRSLMRNLGDSAVPSSSTSGHVEEPWQTELRCTGSRTNAFLRAQGKFPTQRPKWLKFLWVCLYFPGVVLRRGYFTKSEKAAILQGLEQYRKVDCPGRSRLIRPMLICVQRLTI